MTSPLSAAQVAQHLGQSTFDGVINIIVDEVHSHASLLSSALPSDHALKVSSDPSIFDQAFERYNQKNAPAHSNPSTAHNQGTASDNGAYASTTQQASSSQDESFFPDFSKQEQGSPVQKTAPQDNQSFFPSSRSTQAQTTQTQPSWSDNFQVGNVDVGILIQEPTLVLALAIIIEMIVPLPKSFKLEGLSHIFSGLARKVNRSGIKESQRAFAGFFLPTLILSILLFLVLTLDIFSGFDTIVALVVMILVLDLKFPQDRAVLVYRALHEGFKEKAKGLLSTMVLRETDKLSEMGIAKACAESAILRIFSGWFAVMIWFLIAGIEGAVMMQTLNILSRSFNYKLRGNYHFGKFVFIAQQVMLAIPAVVLMFILFCSKNPVAHIVGAKEGMSSYPAAISGMVLGAVGASLNLTLGGPRYYQGTILRLPNIGGSNAPTQQSIIYAMRKIRMCGLLFLVLAIVIDLNF